MENACIVHEGRELLVERKQIENFNRFDFGMLTT